MTTEITKFCIHNKELLNGRNKVMDGYVLFLMYQFGEKY